MLNIIDTSILSKHYINYRDYCEIRLLDNDEEDYSCIRCNKPREPLTFFEKDFYHLPCWRCIGTRKLEREEASENIIRNIKDFYSKILGDRYFQLFIVDDIYFKSTFPHNYDTFKKLINSINPPSRNDIWFLDWNPGYPKIISQDNINGIRIVNLSSIYDIESDKSSIKIGEFEIIPPETVAYDVKHHSRYSILNKSSERKTKRLKLGEKCIKFYNTESEYTKSIFRLKKNGEDISIDSISYRDYVVLKLSLMRNKTFLKLIFDISAELLKMCKIYCDSIFLKNNILINPNKDSIINLIWNNKFEKIDNNIINISII